MNESVYEMALDMVKSRIRSHKVVIWPAFPSAMTQPRFAEKKTAWHPLTIPALPERVTTLSRGLADTRALTWTSPVWASVANCDDACYFQWTHTRYGVSHAASGLCPESQDELILRYGWRL